MRSIFKVLFFFFFFFACSMLPLPLFHRVSCHDRRVFFFRFF